MEVEGLKRVPRNELKKDFTITVLFNAQIKIKGILKKKITKCQMFNTQNPLPFHSYINNTFQFLFLIDTQINEMSRIHIKLYA